MFSLRNIIDFTADDNAILNTNKIEIDRYRVAHYYTCLHKIEENVWLKLWMHYNSLYILLNQPL